MIKAKSPADRVRKPPRHNGNPMIHAEQGDLNLGVALDMAFFNRNISFGP